jgi:hypothetical protein
MDNHLNLIWESQKENKEVKEKQNLGSLNLRLENKIHIITNNI